MEALIVFLTFAFIYIMLMTGGTRRGNDLHHGNWRCPRCHHLTSTQRSMCNNCGNIRGPI